MQNLPQLNTDRLLMRAPEVEDFQGFCDFYATEHSSFVGGPMTPELAWRSLAQEVGHWYLRGFGRWSLIEKGSGAWVGLVGLWQPEGFPENELGWDLLPSATGKGYATEAALAARAFAFDTLGWATLISLIADGNDGSAAVAGRMGAVPDGPFTHDRFGTMTIYRHPNPESVRQTEQGAAT